MARRPQTVPTSPSAPDPIAPRDFPYHVYTLWLVGRDQIKDTAIPSTAFAAFAALSGPVLDLDTSSAPSAILSRLPMAFLWVWIYILLFCLHNQRRPESVREDAANKPWRPIPAKRITSDEATLVLLALYPLAYLFSWYEGVLIPSAILTFLTIWYNDFGGADRNGLVRNFLNGAGFCCFHSSALQIAVGSDRSAMTLRALCWILEIGGLISTTIHIQDFRDHPGDRLRGRVTVLSALGDEACRWTLVVGITFWSLFVPLYWEAGVVGLMSPFVIGAIIVFRLLTQRTIPADSVTYKIWAVWCISFYPLPWVKSLSQY